MFNKCIVALLNLIKIVSISQCKRSNRSSFIFENQKHYIINIYIIISRCFNRNNKNNCISRNLKILFKFNIIFNIYENDKLFEFLDNMKNNDKLFEFFISQCILTRIFAVSGGCRTQI